MGRGQAFYGALQRVMVAHWAQKTKKIDTVPPETLRQDRASARALKLKLDGFMHVAADRLALPPVGNTAFVRPPGTDWSWRPALWCLPLDVPGLSGVAKDTSLGDNLRLFHDCPKREITLRQIRNHRPADLAAFGLQLDVLRFEGSYLSLAVQLPPQAVAGLRKHHVFRVDTLVEMERPLEIFARLNLRHGPNVEQLVMELPVNANEIRAEFDLEYSGINEQRIERVWLDLIFDTPDMTQVVLRDLTVSRHVRAHL